MKASHLRAVTLENNGGDSDAVSEPPTFHGFLCEQIDAICDFMLLGQYIHQNYKRMTQP